MAAITYKFGVQSDVTPLDSASAHMTPEQAEAEGGLAGLGYREADLGIDFAGELSAEVVNKTHASLESMAWLRRVVEEALEGRGFSVQFVGRDVKLVLDEPLPSVPIWNPPTQEGLRAFSLLSWTSKMGTPSFSLPAGATAMGGACPGANAGQTIVPLATLQKRAREVRQVLGRPVRLSQAICQHCYAEGGQYSTGQVQFAQVLRYAWTQQAVADGSFAQVMDWAIKNANFHLEGKGTIAIESQDAEGKRIVERIQPRGEADGQKYFRLHDSGDFWGPEYIAAWKEIADANPDVTFWAPSRVWAVPNLRAAVNEINNPPRNLVIRPSAYHVNEPPPSVEVLGPGWAAGSCAFADVLKPSQASRLGHEAPYQWDCQAYQTDNDKVTCRDARSPDGSIGCRVCWRYGHRDERGGHRGLVVNYTLH